MAAKSTDEQYRYRSTLRGYIGHKVRHNADRNTLTIEHMLGLWVEQRGKCALSGVPMTHVAVRGSGRVITNGSIDCVVPRSKGGLYVPGNVRWVCDGANIARSAFGDDQFRDFCRKIANYDKEFDDLAFELENDPALRPNRIREPA